MDIIVVLGGTPTRFGADAMSAGAALRGHVLQHELHCSKQHLRHVMSLSLKRIFLRHLLPHVFGATRVMCSILRLMSHQTASTKKKNNAGMVLAITNHGP